MSRTKDRPIVEAIRGLGYQVHAIAEMSPGISDTHVLSGANERGAVLLTADKDFGELVFRQRLAHAGAILARLAGYAPESEGEYWQTPSSGMLVNWNLDSPL